MLTHEDSSNDFPRKMAAGSFWEHDANRFGMRTLGIKISKFFRGTQALMSCYPCKVLECLHMPQKGHKIVLKLGRIYLNVPVHVLRSWERGKYTEGTLLWPLQADSPPDGHGSMGHNKAISANQRPSSMRLLGPLLALLAWNEGPMRRAHTQLK